MLAFLRRPVVVVTVLAVAAGGAGVYALRHQSQAKAEAKAEAKAHTPVSPYAAIANGKADVEGGIIPVAARRGGIVREVYVQEGDQVVKNQILARQVDDELRLAAASAHAQAQQIKAQVPALEVQLDSAKRELARLKALQERNFISGQAVDQAADKVRAAEANLIAQRAAIGAAEAGAAQADYNLELTIVRAPADGRIIRRYANPGSGASTLNVSNMFDLEPKAPRIVRAEIPEASLKDVAVGQSVEIVPEFAQDKAYPGKVVRRAGLFGARKLQSDDPSERTDDRVVEVVVSADSAPLLIGQRVLVKFKKPEGAAAAAPAPAPPAPAKKG
jgi:HlyD family secretion protein